MYDLDPVAIGQGGPGEEGTGHDFQIALHRDLARIQAERGEQSDQVADRVVARLTIHQQSHGVSL